MTEQLHPNVDIVIDCADPETLAAFWAEALGYRIVGFGEPYCLLLPARRAYPAGQESSRGSRRASTASPSGPRSTRYAPLPGISVSASTSSVPR